MPRLLPGDPAPWFTVQASNNPNFNFNIIAGRFIVLSFFGSSVRPDAERFLAFSDDQHALFDDANVTFFGVSNDPVDRDRLKGRRGVRFFWDTDMKVARLYGVADTASVPLTTYLIDIGLRVFGVIAEPDPEQHASLLFQAVARLPKLPPIHAAGPSAPVLVLPGVFETGFCRMLIDMYQKEGGENSGFMREQDGKTVGVYDYAHKRRRDFTIANEAVRAAVRGRLQRRVVPEIQKAFQFEVTRMERYIVACYDGTEGGHFRAHRDNTTKGTAHRRFAVTINLNAQEYEGGNLRFPEFGTQTYRAPTGGAVVFSCSLLHEAMPVTSGVRYAFLPFLYDESAAAVREANNKFLSETVASYRRHRDDVTPAPAPAVVDETSAA